MNDERNALRRLTRREFLTLSAGAGASLALSGCGGGPENNPAVQQGGGGGGGKSYDGPNVELKFWNGFTGGDGPVMRQLVEQFSSEHDNINVSMNTMQWDDYYQRVPSAVQSGNGPDVGIMHVDSLGINAARSVILPLDDVASSLDLKESDFNPTVWQAGIYDGQRYGIPLDIHPLGFYYNKGVMERAGLDPENPPLTRDDYMAALEEMKSQGIQGCWVSPFLFTGGFMYRSVLWQNGGDLFNEDATEATFNSEAGVDALNWVVDLVKEGYSPQDVAQDAEDVAFQNGNNAFIWNGIWMINAYKEVPDLEWGVAPLPQIGSEKGTWASSHNFVIMRQRSQDDNKLQAAKVFINWISEHSIEWAKSGQIPARNSVRESEEFQSLEEQSTFAEQLPYVHFGPIVPGIRDVQEQALDTAINEAVLLKKEPEAALDEAVQQANQLLEENRQKYEG